MAVEFAISNWSGWTSPSAPLAPGSPVRTSDSTDASTIPPMLRRRLNTLGRAAAGELLRNLQPGDNPPIVYASRHGDIERTLGVVTELARGESLSPTNFSLAVHNAITGILSIHLGITANITSIAALDAALVPVLLEARGLIGEGHQKVLCVLADVPLPEIYRRDCTWPKFPFAACFTMTAGEGVMTRLSLCNHAHPTANADILDLPEALQFIEFLAADSRHFHSTHNSGGWNIAKC
jgi:hypothetical protein